MDVHALEVRRASPADAAALAAFAARSFEDAFGADNTPEDMATFLAAAYGEDRQRAELTDSRVITLLVEGARAPRQSGPALVAYAQVRRSPAPACVSAEQPVELWRFYVDRRWHGQGVAQSLMDEVYAAARELGGNTIWLSVWERNPRAMAFYRKCGFIDVGSKVFVVGSDRQNDRVMSREIAITSSV